jgi:hypothetical protein
MAQAVFHGDAGVGVPTARAGLGAATDGLTAGWTPPVPSYRPAPLPVARVDVPDQSAQVSRLSERGAEWVFLTPDSREAMDGAVELPARRARWRRVVVEGVGERAGGARDLAFASRRAGEPTGGGFWLAHFLIGNGTRSGDGEIERTGRPLAGEEVVVALVGDFSRSEPTAAQLRALTEVVDYARAKTGMIPVQIGEAARAPMAASVLDRAFNAALAAHPAGDEPRS